MKPKNTRAQRKQIINELTSQHFENYYDYFFYLHLNTSVQKMHTIGMIIGLLILPFAIYHLNWSLFLVYFFFFYGFGFLSHWFFDGVPSRTAKEAPWYTFIYALKINFLFLFGRTPELEKKFLKKYPFVANVYPY